jgi:hypothetical protein
MGNISKIVVINISTQPRVLEEILIGANCKAKEHETYKPWSKNFGMFFCGPMKKYLP